jgi:Tfp pilus assembly PilM family ATPase
MADRARGKVPFWKALNAPLQRKRFRVRTQGSVIALDLDGSLLRVVQTAPRGSRMAVTRITAEQLNLPADTDRPDPAVVGKAIAKALDRLRLKPNAVVMGVPRASVILRTLSLPALDDSRELASMVYFQIGKDLPFRADEAVIDFKVRQPSGVTPQGEADKAAEPSAEARTEPAPLVPRVEVLVAVAKRDVVEFYQKAAAAAGLKLAAIGLLSHGNARCIEACRVAEGTEAVALVSLRPDEVGIDVVAQQSLLFSRGAALKPRTEPLPAPGEPAAPVEAGYGSGAVPTAEDPLAAAIQAAPTPPPETFLDLVAIEVVRSLHSYGGLEPGNPVAKVIVVGATGQEPAVVDALQHRLAMPVTWLDVAGTLDLSRAAREHAAGSISAIGLALGVNDPQGLPFDFLNPKRPPVQRDMRRIRLLAGIAAVTALVIFLLAVRTHLIRQRLALKAAVQAELTLAEKKRPIYRQMRQQATTIDTWLGEAQDWLGHYAYLSSILPPSEEVYLTSFSVSGQGVLRFSVQARSGETLARLDKQLRAAGYDVKPVAITPGADRYGYGFRSTVELVVPEKMKVELSKSRAPARPADDGSLDAAAGKRRGAG